MNLRTDFVTNSSSSSFILTQKGTELTEPQKEAILDYVQECMLGKVILTPESTEEEIQKVFEDVLYHEGDEEMIRKALAEGRSIRHGYVYFEGAEIAYGEIFNALWNKLEEAGPNVFSVIDGDLSY